MTLFVFDDDPAFRQSRSKLKRHRAPTRNLRTIFAQTARV